MSKSAEIKLLLKEADHELKSARSKVDSFLGIERDTERDLDRYCLICSILDSVANIVEAMEQFCLREDCLP